MDKLIDTYKQKHKEYLKIGLYYKCVFLSTSIPVTFFAYYYIKGKNSQLKSDRIEDGNIIWIALTFGLVYFLMIASIKAKFFVNSFTTTKSNRLFKLDLFQVFKKSLPEINFHRSIQKIHIKHYKNSSLFPPNFIDYVGDDFMSGNYKEIAFELSELHVFRLFKDHFHGLFCVIHLDSSPLSLNDEKLKKIQISNEFQQLTANNPVKIKLINTKIYIAAEAKGFLFEDSNIKTLEKTNEDFKLLQKLIYLIKAIVDIEQN